ncbi:hypothetical protein [Halovenus salina]|uniref:Cytochrome-ba3 oxidase subunit n=1 Tax=Halovenus salina TaxID=1510225 RepID=A0ABD5VWD7_9EURY|nr:hypothetical protein [Halovenus salina]
MALSPQRVGLLSLLALVPVGVYLMGTAPLRLLAVVLTTVNVILITASLYYLFGDAPTDLGYDSLPV